MSTDPKKIVKTIIMAYFLSGMLMLGCMQLVFSKIAVIIFTTIVSLLMLSSLIALFKQYKIYHIKIYLVLMAMGILLEVYYLAIAIGSQI